MYYILVDKTIVPVSPLDWINNYKGTNSIKRDELYDKEEQINVSVSTVFLGINHDYNNSGTPILFETMIFGGKYSEYQNRYSTYDEAIIGHQEACIMVDGRQKGREEKLNDILQK
jgi:hypothetical protein